MQILDKIDNKLKNRFFSKVKKIDNGCHLWIGATTNKGNYGSFSILNKTTKPHRVAWIMASNKEIPENMCICHHCDNGLCVNPEHLFLGTHKDNIKDRDNKNRWRGKHKLTKHQILEIYKLYDLGKSTKDIAIKFNIDRTSCSRIVSGKQWKKFFKTNERKYKSCRLTKDQILSIYSLVQKGLTNVTIGNLFKISPPEISRIRNGVRHINLYNSYYNIKGAK